MPSLSLRKGPSPLVTVLLLAITLSLVYSFWNPAAEAQPAEVAVSEFVSDVESGNVESVSVRETRIEYVLRDETEKYAFKEYGQTVNELLEDVDGAVLEHVEIQIEDTSGSGMWLNIGLAIVPFFLIIGFLYFMMRGAANSNNQAMSFGKSTARLHDKEKERTTFADVAGVKEAKEELVEIVDFLKNPTKYTAMGAKIPKGVMLVGGPGTGKTLLARAVAGEANVPFFSISGSEFVEMFVGVGASRVRDLFKKAKRNAPCIVFIDEIDAVGRQRGTGLGGGHDEREQTLNQILTEMDGFETNTSVIVMAASVTGDTPVLVRKNGDYMLKPIAEVVNAYYEEGEENIEKQCPDLEVLGLRPKYGKKDKKRTRVFFGGSIFKQVRSVFRHKVDEIYEIHHKGGMLRTTGNHSVFIRNQQGLHAKRVDQLKMGEYLVEVPYLANRTSVKREIRAHQFSQEFNLILPVYNEHPWEDAQHHFVLAHQDVLSQKEVGVLVGVAQTTVSKWQNTNRRPRSASRAYFKYELPKEIQVSPDLCRLLGYYTAEGYARKEVDFCFNEKETFYVEEVKTLMQNIFSLEPDEIRHQTPHAVNLVYHCKPLAEFFIRQCGMGAHGKHIPNFLFEAPKEYFIEFFRGYYYGDGYEDKRGRIELTSVSYQLLLELNWLSRMHGYKSNLWSWIVPAGRRIAGGKPLPETKAWRLGFGKSQNPLNLDRPTPTVKRLKISKIIKKPYNDYVYDFCGCQEEAFFGGQTPLLLHNTNRPDVLDPALLRPGRFDRRVVVDSPNIEDREQILKVHAKNKPLTKKVDLSQIAKQTPGFSGADLENLMNEAAILAAKKDQKEITQHDIEMSVEKVQMGPERKSHVLSKKEKEVTAYHETGHAIVGHLLSECDPLRKITIISRGMSLGSTWFVPEDDQHLVTREKFEHEMASLLGGYVAEEMIYGQVSTGPSNDLERASGMARRMVTEYGMSSQMGPTVFGEKSHEVFLGRDYGHTKNYSEEKAAQIDKEVENFVNKAYKLAKDTLTKHKKELDRIAKTLIEKETLSRDEFIAIFAAHVAKRSA